VLVTKEHKMILHNEANARYREKMRRENPFKKCPTCGIVKPLDQFTFSKTENRYKSKCHDCRHETYLSEREQSLKRSNDYYQENKESVLAKSHERRKKNIAKEILRSARERARRKGLEFNIEESDIIVPEKCPVLGIPLIQGKGKVCRNSPSIDRINPLKGYVKGNVIIVSNLANTIKTNATPSEIRMVADFYEKLQSSV